MEKKYIIVRFYRDINLPCRVQNRLGRMTLEQAQEHCRKKTTRKEGVWFDGYTEA